MNKKIIIAIVAAIVALALIITAAVVIIKKVDINAPKDGSSSIVSGNVDESSDDKQTDSSNDNKGGSSKGDKDKTPHVNAEKDDAKIGDIVDVPIKITENPGMLAGSFVFEYDKDALEYVDYEKGNILDEYDVNASNGKIICIISSSGLEDIKKTGTLIEFQFKVKDGAKKGDYAIKYSSESQIGNFNEAYVNVKISNAKVTVK